jgi:RNA polymerase sigma-70 factor (ECF subfamily)
MYACVSKTTSRTRFEGLCARYRPDVFRFALWLARDGAIAEDVVQETFLRAWRAIDSLADPEAARSWLLAIARREHARLYERKRHTTVPLDDLIANEDPALASVPSEDSDIGAAISSLNTDYRKPLVLQVLMGYSTEEIARQMGLTRTAVLSRLYRARLKLRAALGTTDVADGTSAVRTIKETPQSCAA